MIVIMMAVLYAWVTRIQEGYLQPSMYNIISLDDWNTTKTAIKTAISDTAKERHVVMYSANASVLKGYDYLNYISKVFDTKIDPENTATRIIIKIDNIPFPDLKVIGGELTEMMNLKTPILAFHIYTFEEDKTTSSDMGIFLPPEVTSDSDEPSGTVSASVASAQPVTSNQEEKEKEETTKKDKKDKKKNN